MIAKAPHIAVIGAGPVGLMQALYLQKHGFNVTVYEKYIDRLASSRSVGIHAPSISLFQELGLAERLLAKAQIVKSGEVFGKSRLIGELAFGELKHPFPMVLTLVQSATEKLLEEACLERAIPIKKGLQLDHLKLVKVEGKSKIALHFITKSVERLEDRKEVVDFMIGADGHKSTVRELIGSHWKRQALPDFYAMADFEDLEIQEQFVEKADRKVRLYLHPSGIVESFPLPDSKRRWVVHYEKEPKENLAQSIVNEVGRRTAFKIPNKASYFSRFQPFVAQTDKVVFKNRVALVGDAAQVVSPIGGQGMNLGWLGCKLLAKNLAESLEKDTKGNLFFRTENLAEKLSNYEKSCIKIGKLVIKQSLRNTWMGRSGWYGVKRFMAYILTKAPFSKQAAKVFSMIWLEGSFPNPSPADTGNPRK